MKFIYIYLWVIMLVCAHNAIAQKRQIPSSIKKNIRITYIYKADGALKDSMYFEIMKPYGAYAFGEPQYYHSKILNFNKTSDTCKTICEYDVNEVSCGLIADGFGREIILIPGDVVNIWLNKRNLAIKTNKVALPWFHDFQYKGKNTAVYQLFDLLTTETGGLHWGKMPSVKRADSTLYHYFKELDSLHQTRLSLISNYQLTHYILPKYITLVNAEIQNAYIIDLIRPLWNTHFSIKDYPEPVIKKIEKFDILNPGLFNKTVLMRQAAYAKIRMLTTDRKQNATNTNENLISIYNDIKRITKTDIRDLLLTEHLDYFLGVRDNIYPSFDSLLISYNYTCQSVDYKRYINYKWASKKSANNPSATLQGAMSANIQDSTGKSVQFTSLLNRKPIVVICWASWCVPCIKELPYEKILEQEYKDKVDFIYLSFDKSKIQWKNKVSELKINGNNYLLTDHFNSNLATFYKINSIPRYLIYDRKGNLVVTNDIRPSDQHQFKSLLDKLVF